MLKYITRIFVSLFFLHISFNAEAQITDDFADNNFTNNPTWSGNDTDFTVNTSHQLQLNSSGTDVSYLSLSNTQSINNAEWNFWIRLNFSPSSSNYGRVYLVSDQSDLNQPLNGYYLQFGEALSNDQVELFRQTGTTSVSVCRGTTIIANAFIIRVKVTRDNAGLWKLFIDPTGNYNYTQEAQGTDNTFTATSFFGIGCTYTSSNATKFYFDDFYIGPIVVDNVPPLVTTVNVTASNQLNVIFNEGVDQNTAEQIGNYFANNGIGNPVTAIRNVNNIAMVQLTFANNFPVNTLHQLQVQNVQDVNGNTINSNNSTPFVYHQTQQFDLLISEIMADPDPQVQLPNYEYIELHNRKSFPVNIFNWKIKVGNTIKVLPYAIIPADSFIVLTSTSGAPNYTNINVVPVTSFPSLTNTGQTITLFDSLSHVIHTLSYSDSWYADPNKSDGGWSLEMIDPSNPCADAINWKASVDVLGGTPGKRNSVRNANSDNLPPQLLRVSVIAPYDTIVAYFDERLDSTTLLNLSTYFINQGIGNPVFIKAMAPDYKSVKLVLPTALTNGTIYTLTVSNIIRDCAGNLITVNNTTTFAIPLPCAPNDIVINEILADPKTGGVDFVEIYNRSNKVIDLKEIFICSMDTITNTFTEIKTISTDGFLIFPGDYIVLTSNSTTVKSQYYTSNTKGFIDMSIPTMNIDGDILVLINQTQVVIDKLIYYQKWHFPILNNTKGVSLERIDFDRTTQDATNWHSAAEGVGYATPAYKNSQYSVGENNSEITISPEIFSPDNDGQSDVVNISYQFNTPGYVANVTIYDSKGRLERILVQNELIGTTGTFVWDGVNDKYEKSKIGIYIIYFEVYNSVGDIKKIKKTCVLASKLR